mmetsp:Transcript_125250/g.304124  ORF Transcript_125250/g.304124 Transcript_125250/m.304124 type:complete len:205 (-) Transcript_125250:476-1090(-)
MASATPVAAATSAAASALSSARTSSAAVNSIVPTWIGVPSFRRRPSPDAVAAFPFPPPPPPPPPRKDRTYSSSASNPLGVKLALSCFALSALLALTGNTVGSVTPRRRFALSSTKPFTSVTSFSLIVSHLFTTKTTFLSHLRMYFKNVTSDSVIGRSAESTKSTRSARGTNSSVSLCCRSKMTFVPGVSTMFTSLRSSAGTSCV